MTDKRNILDRLDATIGAIERHRAVTQGEKAATVRTVNAAWALVLESARELRVKLRDEPKLRYMRIARDDLSISISFRTSDLQGRGDLLDISRNHPEGKYPGVEAIWVNQPGQTERHFNNGDQVVEILVRFVARHLTRTG